MKIVFKKEKGQALLMVIVAMTVALAVVTSVALRNLSTTSRITSTDTSSRVTAASEGGIERFINLSVSSLATLANCNVAAASCNTAALFTAACPSGTTYYTTSPADSRFPNGVCQVNFPHNVGEDNIDARAFPVVGFWPAAGAAINFELKKSQVFEVNMSGYTGTNISVCWKGTAHLYSSAYDTSGIFTKVFLCNAAGCPASNFAGANIIASVPDVSCPASEGFTSRVLLSKPTQMPAAVYGERLRALGADTEVRVTPQAGNNLVNQGYTITSYGELVQNAAITASKKAVATKSLPFLPAIFDFGIYTDGPLP